MAWRQSDAGSTTILYEDFQPKWELREEEGAYLLTVHLPEFSKDEIRVVYVHSMRSVRVQGERPIGNNIWSRFNRAFPVPQNSSVEKIHANFENEKLTVTIPKQTPSTLQPAASSFLNEEAKHNETRANISPKDFIYESNSAARQKTSPASPTPQKPVTEPKAEKGQVQPNASAQQTPKQSIQNEDRKTKGEEKRVDASTPSKAPDETKLEKQSETPPVKEIAAPKGIEKKGERVEEETSLVEKAKEMKNVAAAAIKTTLEEEDRQLLVKMGMAVLVIVAIGAYVTYNIRSSVNAMD